MVLRHCRAHTSQCRNAASPRLSKTKKKDLCRGEGRAIFRANQNYAWLNNFSVGSGGLGCSDSQSSRAVPWAFVHAPSPRPHPPLAPGTNFLGCGAGSDPGPSRSFVDPPADRLQVALPGSPPLSSYMTLFRPLVSRSSLSRPPFCFWSCSSEGIDCPLCEHLVSQWCFYSSPAKTQGSICPVH